MVIVMATVFDDGGYSPFLDLTPTPFIITVIDRCDSGFAKVCVHLHPECTRNGILSIAHIISSILPVDEPYRQHLNHD